MTACTRSALQTWPRHPFHQCGNARLYSARRPPRNGLGKDGRYDAHNLLDRGNLFLNHNYRQISEAFSSPTGVRSRDAARLPNVRPMTIHPLVQTPPRDPLRQCIIKEVGFFAVERPVIP